MQPTPACRPRNPLDLPEIRSQIAFFLDRKNCLACMRVSRDWFHDFAPAVWHTVDFAKEATAFGKVTPGILDKYGGFIATVLNLTTMGHVQSLQHSKVNSVKSMTIQLPDEWVYRELLSDLLLRCRVSITSLDIRSSAPSPNTFGQQRKWAVHYMHVNDLFACPPPTMDSSVVGSQGSCLTTLALTYICVSREGFSSMLQYTPRLEKLSLFSVIVFYHKPGIALYTGSKLRYLSASFSQVFLHDEEDAAAPCLLIHFPLLESWHLNSLIQPTNRRIDLGHLNFSSGCPLLKTLSFQSEEAEAMSTLLLSSFDRLKSCTLPAKSLIMSTTLGLISHLDTLVTITITGEINEAAPMQWVLLIFKLCRNLQVLSFESLVCDIESVENCWWGCPDLRELRVRFKGLDTPSDIEGCLKQVCELRQSGSCSSLKPSKEGAMISTRVAHQLVRLEKLRTVWLGTKDYYLPSSSD